MKSVALAIIILTLGCSHKVQYGTYASKKSPHVLTIRKDGTFAYHYHFQFVTWESMGVWTTTNKKNQILLNSSLKQKKFFLKGDASLVKAVNLNGAKCLLTVDANIPDRQKNEYECLIYINDSIDKKCNCDSIYSLPIYKDVKDIRLRLHSYSSMPGRFFDTLSTSKYAVNSANFNNLKLSIVFDDSLFNYKIFDNKIFTFSKKNIKFYDSISKEWVTIRRLLSSLKE